MAPLSSTTNSPDDSNRLYEWIGVVNTTLDNMHKSMEKVEERTATKESLENIGNDIKVVKDSIKSLEDQFALFQNGYVVFKTTVLTEARNKAVMWGAICAGLPTLTMVILQLLKYYPS